jgi:hypothetical protein
VADTTTIEYRLKELNDAVESHARAKSAASQARSEEIAALNRLNAAQKAVDAWYADLKKAADRETDWKKP